MKLVLISLALVGAAADCAYFNKITDGVCADSCIPAKVGICPQALIVKEGGLTAGTCKDLGYTVDQGEMDQAAGPCGTLKFEKYAKAPLTTGSSSKNIVQLAQSVPDLSTLVVALVAGDLTGALSGAGPFTVFAPTNEAFDKVPAATLAHLLDPANIKELQAVLTYHVIAGAAVFSKDLKAFQMVKTLEGDDLKIVSAGRVIVNKATVTSADNAASNGVVHIIDGVLLPPVAPTPVPTPQPNIVQLAQSVPDLSTLVVALVAGDLTGALSGAGPFTVFAPTNEAFDKVPAATLAHLLDPANIKELQAVLTYHVISGAAVFSKDLKRTQVVHTLEGDDIKIVVRFGHVTVNGNKVTSADNAASNGVVHIIDGVLLPPSSKALGNSTASA